MADTFPIEKMADENPSKTLNSSSESEPRSKKKVQDVLTQRSYNDRSRSRDKLRSRSKEHKKLKSKDKKDKKRRSQSRSRQHHCTRRSKSNKHQKDRKKEHRDHRSSRNNQQLRDIREGRERKDRDTKDTSDAKDSKEAKEPRDKDKGNSQETVRKTKDGQVLLPTEIPMPPMQVPMPSLGAAERRRRERSRSPLDYYRRNQNNNEGQFWDSFSWIPRISYLPNVPSSVLVNTKKMRRLMITNVPFEIGIAEDDLRDLITRYMGQNYLKDQMNNCPVVNMEINEADRNVAVELSSVEETCRICKLEKIQLFKGAISGIIRLGDSCYGNNVVTQAQTAAQAQAAAFAAINVLENKKTQFSIEASFKRVNQSSTVLRITNAVTTYMAGQLNKEQWSEYEQDLLEGFSQYGVLIHHWFVKKEEKDICANPGNLFIEYECKEQGEKAMEEMQDRIYDQRPIKIYYIPRDIYYRNFQKNLTPPALKGTQSKPDKKP